MIYAKGTRIELLSMPNDPDPIPPGTRGTIIQHANPGSWAEQLWIKWDIDRSLCLIPGVDQFRIVPTER